MFSTLEEAWSKPRRPSPVFTKDENSYRSHHELMCDRKLDDVVQCSKCRTKLHEMFSPEDDNLKEALLNVFHILKRRVSKLTSYLKNDENNDNMILIAAIAVLLLIMFDIV